MENLEADLPSCALQKADALAIMHSEARIDAADVEFALGGAPFLTLEPPPAVTELTNMEISSSTDIDAVQSNTSVSHMWLLDFNECQPI